MVNFIDNETPLSAENLNKLQSDLEKYIEEKINGSVLFEAESGETGVSGTVTLSDVVSNYDYLEITYIDNVGAQATVKYIPEISEFVNLTIIAIDNATTLFIKNRQCVVSGNTIANKSNSINAEMSLTSTTQSVYQLENAIKIIKVVGYK